MSSNDAQIAISIIGTIGSAVFIALGGILLCPQQCARKENAARIIADLNAVHTMHMTHGIVVMVAFIFFFWVPLSIYPISNGLDTGSTFGNNVRNQFECITWFTFWVPTWVYLWRQAFFGMKVYSDKEQKQKDWIEFSSYATGGDLIGPKAIGLWFYLILAIVGALSAFILSYFSSNTVLADFQHYWFIGWVTILYIIQVFVITAVYAAGIKHQSELRETYAASGYNLTNAQRKAIHLIGHRLLHLIQYDYWHNSMQVQKELAAGLPSGATGVGSENVPRVSVRLGRNRNRAAQSPRLRRPAASSCA